MASDGAIYYSEPNLSCPCTLDQHEYPCICVKSFGVTMQHILYLSHACTQHTHAHTHACARTHTRTHSLIQSRQIIWILWIIPRVEIKRREKPFHAVNLGFGKYCIYAFTCIYLKHYWRIRCYNMLQCVWGEWRRGSVFYCFSLQANQILFWKQIYKKK